MLVIFDRDVFINELFNLNYLLADLIQASAELPVTQLSAVILYIQTKSFLNKRSKTEFQENTCWPKQ